MSTGSAAGVPVAYPAKPSHIGDWVWQPVGRVARTATAYTRARSGGRRPARPYVVTNVVQEIFVHHRTRYAVEQAMREGYSPIYAGFYAFDEAAHAFGPGDRSVRRALRHVDHTIRKIASRRGGLYELVVLSDHGQVDTIPFAGTGGRPVGEVLAEMLPGFRVQEVKGKAYGPPEGQARGGVTATLSGGLAHRYFAERRERIGYRELMALHPGLVPGLAR